jgi:hypothetical protein
MSDYESIWPRTFVIKMTKHPYYTEANPVMIASVWGGRDDDVWVASFADREEAESWIIGSNHFGQQTIGVKLRGTPRANGGDVPQEVSQETGGSGGETHQSGGEFGSGPAGDDPAN